MIYDLLVKADTDATVTYEDLGGDLDLDPVNDRHTVQMTVGGPRVSTRSQTTGRLTWCRMWATGSSRSPSISHSPAVTRRKLRAAAGTRPVRG